MERQEVWGCQVASGLHDGMPNPAEELQCMGPKGDTDAPLGKEVQQWWGWSEAEPHPRKTWSAICV